MQQISEEIITLKLKATYNFIPQKLHMCIVTLLLWQRRWALIVTGKKIKIKAIVFTWHERMWCSWQKTFTAACTLLIFSASLQSCENTWARQWWWWILKFGVTVHTLRTALTLRFWRSLVIFCPRSHHRDTRQSLLFPVCWELWGKPLRVHDLTLCSKDSNMYKWHVVQNVSGRNGFQFISGCFSCRG